MLEIKEIKKNYERFDNSKIQRIAESESKGLRDEIIPILIEEVKKRNLGKELIEWIEAERRKLSKSELQELKAKVRNCTCGICKQNSKLKGYKFDTVVGIVVVRIISNHQLIVCEECGKKKNFNDSNGTFWLVIGKRIYFISFCYGR